MQIIWLCAKDRRTSNNVQGAQLELEDADGASPTARPVRLVSGRHPVTGSWDLSVQQHASGTAPFDLPLTKCIGP